MNSELRNRLKIQFEAYQEQRSIKNLSGDSKDLNARISYGTAGFRGRVSQIEHLFYNIGIISGLKCWSANNENIGIMITASHNPIEDNGVKFVEANGEMLSPEWEKIVEEFCNTKNTDEILNQIDQIVGKFNLNIDQKCSGQVIFGMDTRPSSEALLALVKQGLNVWSGKVDFVDYGLVTTPVLHYLIAESNRNRAIEINVARYYNQLVEGIDHIFSAKEPTSLSNYSPDHLVVDCANGVGFVTMQSLLSNKSFAKHLPAKLINSGEGILNKSCGADFVKANQTAPSGASDMEKRYASLDGDADRIVYFYLDSNDHGKEMRLNLLDGDKIMALYALYFKDLMQICELTDKLTIGCVQTAYANGASTQYLSGVLNIQVDCVDTGVKNLHKQAIKYDIGIYFEANGHGTVWFSEKAKKLIESNSTSTSMFEDLFKIINNFTGDAISNILLVETILRHYDWHVRRWFQLYQDRPNSLAKVEIDDRDSIKVTDAGRTCIEPAGLQEAINEEVSKYGCSARSFVRPSGTENVVRVYAEAESRNSADELSRSVCELVRKFNRKNDF